MWDPGCAAIHAGHALIPFAFPRPPSRAMTNVVNDNFVSPDFIHHQIIADRESSKSRFAGRLAHVWCFRNPRRRFLDARNKARGGFSIVLRDICKISSRSASAPRSYRSFMRRGSG
jgi:hypothetical protein